MTEEKSRTRFASGIRIGIQHDILGASYWAGEKKKRGKKLVVLGHGDVLRPRNGDGVAKQSDCGMGVGRSMALPEHTGGWDRVGGPTLKAQGRA